MSGTSNAPSRSSHIALIISLCVNLLLAGLVAIPLIRFAVHGPMFDRHGPGMMGQRPERSEMHNMLSPRMLLQLAPERSADIRNVLDKHHGRIDQLREQSMAARRKVMEIFSAEKFDQAAFDKALSDMQAADAAFETEIRKVVSETAGLLTPEERKRAAEMRNHHRGGMFRRHGGSGRGFGHDDPPPPPQAGEPGGEAPAGGPPSP